MPSQRPTWSRALRAAGEPASASFSIASTSPRPPPVGRPAMRSSAASPTSVSQQPTEPQRHGDAVRVDRHVADLAAVARRPGQRLAIDDQPAADAVPRPEMNSTCVGSRSRRRAGARPARRGPRRWRPRSGPATSERVGERAPERHVAPAEVGGHRHEAVAPPDDADDRHPDADRALVVGVAASAGRPPARRGRRRSPRPRCGRCGRSMRTRSKTSPPSPTMAAASESTAISSARTTAPCGIEADDRRRPAGCARRLGALLGYEVGRRQLADQAADRAAGQAGPGHELGARRGPPAWSSRTIALRFARRTVSLRCPTASSRIVTGLCSFLPNVVTHWSTTPVRVKHPDRGTERTMTSLRWGVLSTADIARKKVIPGLLKADALRGRRDRLARRGPGPRPSPTSSASATAHGSYEALLADPDVDVVYIPLPNHLHAEWTIAAARAGKHVLCEKPLAMTAADAERMVEACADAGVRLMEAFMYRHHPSWVAAMEVVASGRIGRLRAVQSWFSYYNDDPANIRNQLEAGGGALYRHRLLLGQPVADAVRRRARRGRGLGHPRPGERRRHADQRDPRVRRRRRDLHLLDPGRDRPARPRLRQRGAAVDRDPVQHPARPADARVRDRRRRPAGGAGDRDTDLPDEGPVHAPRPSSSRPPSSTALPTPTPPEDAVANLRVIERIFAAGNRGAA